MDSGSTKRPIIMAVWGVAISAFVALVPLKEVAAADNCAQKTRYLQISYDFPWPEAAQAQLANQFESGCVSPQYLSDLTDNMANALAKSGITLRQISVLPSDKGANAENDVVSLRLVTGDGAAKSQASASSEQSVLLPLMAPPSGAVITALEILGVAQEGDELIARYAVNEKSYQQGGGKLRLQWLRDGVVIEGASKSRYLLQKQDVGAQISARLAYVIDGAMSDRRTASVITDIMAANYPPRIEDLRLEGEAQTGEELVARYVFIDENEGDSEDGTTFIWLRDNIAIAGATGPSYRLGARDIDKQITVRITPQSQDGQTGTPRSVSLAQTVRPAPIIANREVIDNIVADDADKTLDVAQIKEAIEEAIEEAGDEAVAKPAEKIVTIAKPKARPAPPVLVDEPELAEKAKEKLAEKAEEKPAPAIIIAEESDEAEVPKEADAPALLSEPSPPPTVLTPGFEIAANSPKTFKQVVFSPSAILLDYELFNTQKAVQGTPITLGAIKTVLDEVNALYLEKGFELSRALLPEQLVTDGTVTIQLVEATIGKITLENREDLTEEFILGHLNASEGDYISLKALERSIRLYNLSNKSKLSTELAPGAEFGQTDVFVDVAEPDKVELPSVSINNYANQTSDWRQNAVAITMNNLLGTDDETALSYSDSSGSTSMSGSFSMPLNHEGANLSVAVSNSDTKIVAGSEDTVGYRGSATSYAATLSHPVLFGDEYSLYVSGSYGISRSDLVQPVTGDMLSKSEVRKYSITAPYSYNNGTTAVSVAPSWHILNIVTEIPKREKWMQKFDVNANASHFLSDKWTLNGRARMLYSDARDMINMPSEILSVGGPSSVRAYQPGESSGYQGYFLTSELRTDLANWEEVSLPDFMPSAQTYFFVDHMLAQSQYRERRRADYWSGYGVGLQIPSIFNLLTFDVYWSEALDGSVHEEEKEFYDDELFQFSLSARFRLQ